MNGTNNVNGVLCVLAVCSLLHVAVRGEREERSKSLGQLAILWLGSLALNPLRNPRP